MVRDKRPADKPATSHSKRQKILCTSSRLSSPNKDDEETSDIGLDGIPEDDERLTQEIQSKLDKLKTDHVKRNKAGKDFEDRVKREQGRLSHDIKSAMDKIKEKRSNFRSCMLPVLNSALRDLSVHPNTLPRESDVITIKPKVQPAALQDANDAVDACTELLACYKKAASIPTIPASTARVRNTFEGDKDETMRAFESAKKLTINQIQTGFADKTNEVGDIYNLDHDEHHLARKVLVRGKGSSPVKIHTNIGPLLYQVAKLVGKMQNMIDG